MTFEHALTALRGGKIVTRPALASAGVGLFLVGGSRFNVNRAPLNQHLPDGAAVAYHPHIDWVRYPIEAKTEAELAQAGPFDVGVWTPTQLDILADDWLVMED